MIEARDLVKRYGSTTAVNDLSFSIRPGLVTGFLGPNGAGKTTTMRMILGLDAPTQGSVTVDGRSYRDLPAPMREVGALLDAKAKALSLVDGYTPPKPHEYHLPGPSGRTALSMAVHDFVTAGKATPYDVVVSDALAVVLTGGDVDYADTLSEDDISKLERKAFIGLCKQDGTVDRIEQMLTTGKPLRN